MLSGPCEHSGPLNVARHGGLVAIFGERSARRERKERPARHVDLASGRSERMESGLVAEALHESVAKRSDDDSGHDGGEHGEKSGNHAQGLVGNGGSHVGDSGGNARDGRTSIHDVILLIPQKRPDKGNDRTDNPKNCTQTDTVG